MADLPDGSPTIAVKSPTISTATMAEVLEQPQPPQHDREAEVEVGGGGVDAELDPQRPVGGELLAQLLFGDDVDRARGEQLHLAVDVHGGRR